MAVINYIEILSDYNVVSFDVFDTLIFRTVPCPEDIFEIIPIKLPQIPGIQYFRERRIKAEQKARFLAKGNEVNIDEIYKQINYPVEYCETIKNVESELEINNCIPNKQLVSLVQDLYDKGIKVVITTDMYLSRNTIERILEKIGIKYYKLYISGEIKKTKESGELFDYILKDISVSANAMVHIGDNPKSDIKMPESRGIKAIKTIDVCCPEEEQLYLLKKKRIGSKQFNEFLKKTINIPVTPAVRVGYNVLGPFLYDFCEWLHQQKEERHLDRLLFVAREGFLIEKCYRAMYPEESEMVSYVSLNKNVMRCSYIKSCEDKVRAYLKTIPELKEKPLGYVLSFLGKCDTTDAENVVRNEEILNGKYDDVINLTISKKKDYIDEQDGILREYLHQVGAIGKKIGLVNNSLNGTGQMLLEEILKDTGTEIIGLQFVCTNKCKSRLGNRFCSYFTDKQLFKMYNHDFQLWCYVLEHLMFENVGTTLKLEKSGGFIKPVCDKQRNEHKNKDILDEIQVNAISFVHNYKNNLKISIHNYAPKLMWDMLSYPKEEDAQLIGGLYNDDEQGDGKLVDSSKPFKLGYAMSRNIPQAIHWVDGYFTLVGMSPYATKVYKTKQWLNFEIQYIKYLLNNKKL